MNTLTRYRPGFFSGFETEEAEFHDLESLTQIPWLEGFRHEGFSHFAKNGNYLMAFYKDGKEWWAAGICKAGSLPDDLPVAVYPKHQPMNQPAPPQASKLPETFDAALLGVTVSLTGEDRFAYSLKTLIGLTMAERHCQAPEARQIILSELVKPYPEICWINDEILLGTVEEDEKPKIIVPKKIGNRKYR